MRLHPVMPANAVAQSFGFLEIGILRPERNQFTQRRKAALQLPADLAVLAEQKGFYHARSA